MQNLNRLVGRVVCLIFIVCLVLAFSTPNVGATLVRWAVLESNHFILFYPEGRENQAEETLRNLEHYLPKVNQITGNEQIFKTRIILQDMGIMSNGYANSFGNKISLFTNTPAPNSVLASNNNWLRLVGVHELTHIRQLTNVSGISRTATQLFGNLFSPNIIVPNWIIEGITVYTESQLSPYEGRLNDGYYDAVVASKVQADDFPSIWEAAYPHHYFPGGQWYIYGGTFFRFLADTYGEEKFAEFFNEYSSFYWAHFLGIFTPDLGIDIAAKKIFGKGFVDLFNEWEVNESSRHCDWKIDGEQVLAVKEGQIMDMTAYDGKLYYFKRKTFFTRPFVSGRVTSLVEFDPITKKERILKQFVTASPTRMQIMNDRIYFTLNDMEAGYANYEEMGYGVVAVLYSYDLQTGTLKQIFSDEFKAFTILADGQIIYAKDIKSQWGSEIWKFADGKKYQIGSVDQAIGEMILDQQELMIVSKEYDGSWGIYRLNPDSLTIELVIDTPWIERSIFVQNNTLTFTANFDREYGIYQYDLVSKDVRRLTVGGYAVNGVPLNDQIYFVGIFSDGEGIYEKEATSTAFSLPETEQPNIYSVADDVSLQEQSFTKKNMEFLLKPNMRLIPALLGGEDGLGATNYTVNISSTGLDCRLTSKRFAPWIITVGNMTTDRYMPYIYLQYPFYRSLKNGLSSMVVDCYVDRSEITTGYSMQFNYPRQIISLYWENKDFSDQMKVGVTYNYALDKGNFQIGGAVFNNYLLGSDQLTGVTGSVDYLHRLVALNKGNWHTTFFLSDIYGDLYIIGKKDFAKDGISTTVGYELQSELSMGYALSTVWNIGVSYSDGEIHPYLKYNIVF